MSPGSVTVYAAKVSLLLFAASIATTVTLYSPEAFAAVIVPVHVSFPASASSLPSAVTLATPDISSVTLTVTLIGSFGSTSV